MAYSPFEFDAKEIREEARKTSSRQLKREWIKKGFSNQMSLYGAIYSEDEDRFEGRRIEILGDQAWNKRTLKAVADSFNEHLPHFKYSIWLFTNKTLRLKLLGGYD